MRESVAKKRMIFIGRRRDQDQEEEEDVNVYMTRRLVSCKKLMVL